MVDTTAKAAGDAARLAGERQRAVAYTGDHKPRRAARPDVRAARESERTRPGCGRSRRRRYAQGRGRQPSSCSSRRTRPAPALLTHVPVRPDSYRLSATPHGGRRRAGERQRATCWPSNRAGPPLPCRPRPPDAADQVVWLVDPSAGTAASPGLAPGCPAPSSCTDRRGVSRPLDTPRTPRLTRDVLGGLRTGSPRGNVPDGGLAQIVVLGA
ncbi:hypothetical protein LV779_34510 [Streptomyces thinghirensis]|nr:hypothetical protein [Streptomyces thinghirensis]